MMSKPIQQSSYFPVFIAFGFLIMVLIQTAWLCDDAFITFRTIDNFQNGYGLTWNPAERVQTYTHPLWMFLLGTVSWVFGDIPLSAVGVSLLVSIAAAGVLVFAAARSAAEALVMLAALISSKAFIDYSTSGLENPLSHLFLVLFVWVYWRRPWNAAVFLRLSIIAGLAVLTRMDTVLIYLPALFWVGWRMVHDSPCSMMKAVKLFALGMLPLIAWMGFSLFYYGYPLPNTAYAKLGSGPERSALVLQGAQYIVETLIEDPVTILSMLLGTAMAGVYRETGKWPLAAGLLLYTLYVIWIGGDFMLGRFLSLPFVLAVMLYAHNRFTRFGWDNVWSVVILVAIGLLAPRATLLSQSRPQVPAQVHDSGIADERAFFYPYTGLLNYDLKEGFAQHHFAHHGKEARQKGQRVVIQGPVGMMGFYAGPTVHIVDHYGVCDPLLAHLPFDQDPRWRVGHFNRPIPSGYIKSVRENSNCIHDPDIALFYEKVRWLTRRPLFSTQRMIEIVKMNLGVYHHLLKTPAAPPVPNQRIAFDELQTRVEKGASSTGPGTRETPEEGLQLVLEKTVKTKKIEIAVDFDDVYQLIWLHEDEALGSVIIQNHAPFVDGGMVVKTLNTPSKAVENGFDALRLFPLHGTEPYRVGHVVLKPIREENPRR